MENGHPMIPLNKFQLSACIQRPFLCHNFVFKHGVLHIELDWLLMQKILKILIKLIYCILTSLCTCNFRSSKYEFVYAKHGISEVTLISGSNAKNA